MSQTIIDMHHELRDFSESIARETGELLKSYFRSGGDLDERMKSPRNVLTKADLEAEELLRRRIIDRYPDHEIIGEEFSAREGREYRWYIDPLDGTTNFAAGIPHWAVSIGVCDAEGEAVGVVYDPLRDELYSAVRGGGASMNGKRLKVSSVTSIENSLCSTGFASMRGDAPDHECIDKFRRVLIEVKGVRRIGSAALDLAYVAAGRFEFFFEEGLGPWDLCAGALIVKESGGACLDYASSTRYLESGSIVAGNAEIVGKALKLIEGR